ncbi:anti-sigma-factor antagonist /anti-anti-sigma regulatory factor, SpoIIAA [Nocardioides scoriae]|uniref:Anti-sigma factor antagonist n=1 Tax=Nocardioides scoriae TaxID=642780 RepID=A0A1H1MDE6_9ACTN|nr:STAS domain-containing protein [Nocardioides scoriae]SDR84385.1 anti-sigma-factor antagonist /anti-anti-sigma regulatory factor, SpoIIAA [Nocardioides scoriae]
MTTRETSVPAPSVTRGLSSLLLPDGAQADLRLAGESVTVTVRGEVDLHTSSCLRQTLAAAVQEEADLVLVHLDEVTFLDSTGLGVLVGAWKAQQAHGRRLELVCSRPEPLKLLRITGLDRVLTVHPGRPGPPR